MGKRLKHYLQRIKEDGLSVRFWVSNFLTFFRISLPFSVFFDKETSSKLRLSTASAAHKVFRDKYDPSLNKAVFKHFISPGDTVFDVGANIGMYTIFSSQLVGDAGKVYAFEPTRISFQNLISNIALNKLGNVIPVYSAVSSTNGLAEFVDHDQSKEQNYLLSSSGNNDPPVVRVSTVRLDTYLSNYNINEIDFLEIDVEGAELSVLKSLGEKICSVSAIFFESSPRMCRRYGYEVADVVNFLKQAGFKVLSPKLNEGKLKLSPFSANDSEVSGDLVAVKNHD